MKKLGLIVLLCVVSLYGCKSRTSHVQKMTVDSLSENREESNLSLQATAYRTLRTQFLSDSSWKNAIRLKNFSGTIYTDSRLEGSADEIAIKQSGNKRQEQENSMSEEDSTYIQSQGNVESKTKVEKRNTVADKETKGTGVPWYIWLIGLGAVACLIYVVYNRIKSKLKLF